MRAKPQLLKILETLDREGHLSNKKISEISGVPPGTARAYTSILTKSGELRRHKDLRGIFELTEKGRLTLMKLREEGGEAK